MQEIKEKVDERDEKLVKIATSLTQILTKAYELKTKHPHTFTDIPENHWARDAISALQSNKVAVGTGDGKFQPEMLVTRGQFAKFLQRSIDNSPGKWNR